MRSNAIPAEFEDLLSASGKRVLAGTHALCGTLANPRTRFLARGDLLDRTKAERVRRVLEASLADKLELMERPIPPETISDMRRDYGERLPKTSRARTIYFESRREPGVKAAEDLREFPEEAFVGRIMATEENVFGRMPCGVCGWVLRWC